MSERNENSARFEIATAYAIVIGSYLIALLFSDAQLRKILTYESLIETLGALFFLLASIGLFWLHRASSSEDNHFFGRRTKRNVYIGLLAILMFICFGEETSWGQMIFGWRAPQFFSEVNAQSETNFHNIWIVHQWNPDGSEKTFVQKFINMNRLFSIFWLFFFVVLPTAASMSPAVRRWVEFTGLPIPPLWVGGLFLTSIITYKLILLTDAGAARAGPLDELKESTYAFVFFVLALFEIIRTRRGRSVLDE